MRKSEVWSKGEELRVIKVSQVRREFDVTRYYARSARGDFRELVKHHDTNYGGGGLALHTRSVIVTNGRELLSLIHI